MDHVGLRRKYKLTRISFHVGDFHFKVNITKDETLTFNIPHHMWDIITKSIHLIYQCVIYQPAIEPTNQHVTYFRRPHNLWTCHFFQLLYNRCQYYRLVEIGTNSHWTIRYSLVFKYTWVHSLTQRLFVTTFFPSPVITSRVNHVGQSVQLNLLYSMKIGFRYEICWKLCWIGPWRNNNNMSSGDCKSRLLWCNDATPKCNAHTILRYWIASDWFDGSSILSELSTSQAF